MEKLLSKGLSTASLLMTKASALSFCSPGQGGQSAAGTPGALIGDLVLEAVLPMALAAGLALLACAVAPDRTRKRAAPPNPYGASHAG
jgi:hypothetical protein